MSVDWDDGEFGIKILVSTSTMQNNPIENCLYCPLIHELSWKRARNEILVTWKRFWTQGCSWLNHTTLDCWVSWVTVCRKCS